jgi:IclR family acetate operon transcriptional repressor
MLARLSLEAFTPYTITSRARLSAALDEIRRQGNAVDRGEWRSDVHCVAAPIIDPDGRALAAMSVSARSADLAPHWEDQMVTVLLQVTQEANRYVFGTSTPA